MKRSMDLLPQIPFSILLALSLKPRHGYEIIKQVELDSLGKIKMSPGTLYGAIKQLLELQLIEELAFAKGERRRYYHLTKAGTDQLHHELDYFRKAVDLADQRLHTAFTVGFVKHA